MGLVLNGTAREDGQRLLEVLADFGPILAIKLYRLNRGAGPNVPHLPCLDHEAMLGDSLATLWSASWMPAPISCCWQIWAKVALIGGTISSETMWNAEMSGWPARNERAASPSASPSCLSKRSR